MYVSKMYKKDEICLFLSAWNETKTHISVIDWERWSSLKNNRPINNNPSLYQKMNESISNFNSINHFKSINLFKSFNHFINHSII